MRSQTGSGKTAAYVLPILQKILQRKASSDAKSTSALILAPTRELAQQISKTITSFTSFCSKDIRVVNITQKIPDSVQRTLLAELPDIVVATPASAARNIDASVLDLKQLTDVIIDEADLVLSYGYDEDLQVISTAIPKGIRTSLVSATLTADISTLKDLFCRDPEFIDLEETADSGRSTIQYAVRCAEDEKFLLAYVLFKLKLIKGKCIIFVSDIERCYRLKLFLEQFGIRSCILNSELPVNSRVHVVEEFNKNVYDIIIASDEHEMLGDEHASISVGGGNEEGEDQEVQRKDETGIPDQDTEPAAPPPETPQNTSSKDEEERSSPRKKRRKASKKEKEYGISRGIDFQNVACVLNFDFPPTSKSYTHRIGRTARAGKSGMALSFIIPADMYKKHKSTTTPTSKNDEEILGQVEESQGKRGKEVKAYHFDMKQVDAFRYRMTDALRSVTRLAVREARTRELRQELLKSEKLKKHFEENPEDLRHLRHDGENRAVRIQPHLKHVPDYLMPNGNGSGVGRKAIAGGDEDIGFVGFRKETDNRIRKVRMQKRMSSSSSKGKGGGGRGGSGGGKKINPLKSFSAGGRR